MPSLEEQIKSSVTDIKTSFEEFKKQNDARLEKIEKKGYAGGDIEEKMSKHGDAIDNLVKTLEEQKTALNRLNAGGDDAQEKPEVKNQKAISDVISNYMRKGVDNDASRKAFNDALPREYKTLVVGSDPDGGYFVSPEKSAEIVKKIFETSPLRAHASSITIGSDAYEFLSNDSQPTASWAGEQTTRSVSTTSQVLKNRIQAEELTCLPQASQKLLEDAAVDVEAWHRDEVSELFVRKENTGFFSGTGVLQPRGLLTYTAGTGSGQIEQVVSGISAGITADSLVELQFALFEAYQPNARFFAARATFKYIRKLKDGEGRYLWALEGDLKSGYMQTILGKPAHWMSDMEAIGASSLSVAYGDFKAGYLIVDRLGISILRDPYSNKPYVQFYTRKRVGGGVKQYQAIKLLKLAVS